MSEMRLTRSSDERMVAGVCGGLAQYLEIDPVFVRLAFILLLFATGIGLPIYIILWVVMPEDNPGAASSQAIVRKSAEEGSETWRGVGRPGTIGLILILLGSYFLLSEIGLLDWMSGMIFWPLLLIGVGVYLLVRRRRKSSG